MAKSVYIHIPFCRNICSYCDFSKVLYQGDLASGYLVNLKKEIEKYYQGESIKTLYIGGGTPSVLSTNNLEKLFSILNTFILESTYEFTFECNIEDITLDLLSYLKDNKVNRLSIGIETFQDKFLSFLNRKHSRQDSLEKLALVKEVGFTNINIDLMYAFNNQTVEDIGLDLDIFYKLDIPHISVYSLIIENNTMLAVNKEQPISDEVDASMYMFIEDSLEKHGYIHYEVSNYGKVGFESRHNLTYWNNDEYYGFGLGAGGYINNTRYNNTRSITQYNQGYDHLEEELLTKRDSMSNYMILGLRKLEGVSKEKFFRNYGKPISESYDIIDLLENHLLEETKTHFLIPKDKIYISNEILIRFL